MVHATSAVALAIVAFNTASTMAYPVVFGGDELEMRSEPEFANFKRAVEQAALPKGPHAPSAATPVGGATKVDAGLKNPLGKAGSAKAGAMRTVEAVFAPRPTICKKGERISAKNSKQRLFRKGGTRAHAAGSKGPHEGASGAGSRKHGGSKKHEVEGSAPSSASASASASPALVPRATPATPPKGAAGAVSGGASGAGTTPTASPGKGHAAKGGKITTTTRKGRDGNTTVYHIHHGTKTPCYAQATGAAKGGAHGNVDAKATPLSGSEKPQKTPSASKTSLKAPPAADHKTPSKTTADPKLVARYEELLERYYGEIDELD